MKKNTTEVKVTWWMNFKAQGKMRWKLTKDFLKKFFYIHELVYVQFTYEVQRLNKDGEIDKHRLPTKDSNMILAYVSRATPIKKVEALFDVKPPINHIIKLTGAKVIPIGKIKKA